MKQLSTRNAYFVSVLLSVVEAVEKIGNGESKGKAYLKMGIDLGVGGLAFVVGGPPGIVIALAYLALEQSGAVDYTIDKGAEAYDKGKSTWNGLVSYLISVESALRSRVNYTHEL